MKRTLILLSVAVVLCGCGDGMNQTKVREAVRVHFGTTEIAPAPNSQWEYIVRATNGAIWYVECHGAKAEVTAKTQLFPSSQ